MLYVDHAKIAYRRMRMSHLVADTSQELAEAESLLQLPPGSVQHPNTPKEHLDICDAKRTAAIALGAQPVNSRDIVEIVRKKRDLAQTN